MNPHNQTMNELPGNYDTLIAGPSGLKSLYQDQDVTTTFPNRFQPASGETYCGSSVFPEL
jgi:hypothetical protein